VENVPSTLRLPVSGATRARGTALRAAQLLGACAVAVAQPLFNVLGKNPGFFALHGATPTDIVLFALIVTLVPPLALLVVELLVDGIVSYGAAIATHYVLLGGLGALFALRALKVAGFDNTRGVVVVAAVVGVAVAVAAWRLRIARLFLMVLGATSLVFIGIFLFGSRVEDLVFPNNSVSGTSTNPKAAPPIVFVLFDELPVIDLMNRKEQIDAKRYPNFARLARTSTWFRNTTTPAALPAAAVPVVLTGNPPKRGALPLAPDYPDNLFTLLSNAYRLEATEAHTRLCPPTACDAKTSIGSRLSSLVSQGRLVYLHLLAPASVEDRLPEIDESPKAEEHAAARVEAFDHFVSSIHGPGRGAPTLYFLDAVLPGSPWVLFPDGRAAVVTMPFGVSDDAAPASLALQARQRRLLQLGYTDRLLGKLIHRLRATGLWSDALVVVAADRGLRFRDSSDRTASASKLADLAFTPFFVKLPRQRRGEIVDRRVSTADILPTIADAASIHIPWRTSGRSALSGGSNPKAVKIGRVSAGYASALAHRRRSLQRQLALLGSDWGSHFFGSGPYRGLVGKRIRSLRIAGTAGGVVVDPILGPMLRSLPRGGPLVPSPLFGSTLGAAIGDAIAVAVNGRIVATTRVFQDKGQPVRVGAVVPDSAFRPGRNKARMFLVTGPVATPTLRELRVTLLK